mmetsp:Transcript_32299/g.78821  ORF Transcript_32299/g.78821 Transcript_32299/m.78821 type:complete len:202 (-) Transcript_32299:1836-2441(-)
MSRTKTSGQHFVSWQGCPCKFFGRPANDFRKHPSTYKRVLLIHETGYRTVDLVVLCRTVIPWSDTSQMGLLASVRECIQWDQRRTPTMIALSELRIIGVGRTEMSRLETTTVVTAVPSATNNERSSFSTELAPTTLIASLLNLLEMTKHRIEKVEILQSKKVETITAAALYQDCRQVSRQQSRRKFIRYLLRMIRVRNRWM